MQFVIRLLRTVLLAFFKVVLFFFYIDVYEEKEFFKNTTPDERLLCIASQKFGCTEVYILSTLGRYTNCVVDPDLFFEERTLHPKARKWLQEAVNDKSTA